MSKKSKGEQHHHPAQPKQNGGNKESTNRHVYIEPGTQIDFVQDLRNQYNTAQTEDNTHKRKQLFWTKIAAGLLFVSAIFSAWQGCSTKRAAKAAESAARTAASAMQIDQRPYVVPEGPEFFPAGHIPMPDQEIQVNLLTTNIGKTPAMKYIDNVVLVRWEPPSKSDPDAHTKVINFLNNSFNDLKAKNAEGRSEIEKLRVEKDLPPNRPVFGTEGPIVISTEEFPRLKTGHITLYLLGVVTYADSFGTNYETQFCFFYQQIHPTDAWRVCDSYNTIK